VGLDVYVGSLTRYYSGDWKLPTQAWAEEMGMPFGLLGDHVTKEGPKRDREEIRDAILRWRVKLGRRLEETLDWDESDAAPYLTEKPGFEGYAALQLWATCDDHPGLRPPPTAPWKGVDASALRDGVRGGSATRYPNLARPVALWLPFEGGATVQAPNVTDDPVTTGSSPRLLEELRLLNSRTWKADPGQLWEYVGTLPDPSLEAEACAAFGLVLKLAEFSVRRRLPMLLDA